MSHFVFMALIFGTTAISSTHIEGTKPPISQVVMQGFQTKNACEDALNVLRENEPVKGVGVPYAKCIPDNQVDLSSMLLQDLQHKQLQPKDNQSGMMGKVTQHKSPERPPLSAGENTPRADKP